MVWKTYAVVLLIVLSGVFYYNLTGNAVIDRQEVFVLRAVDGDTIEFKFGDSEFKARLKGINTPEKNMLYYEEAKEFLADKVEGKKIEIINFGTDKYGRFLIYIFTGAGENVNKEILRDGFGHFYEYEKDDYSGDLKTAEGVAQAGEIGIWKKSINADCVRLIELQHDEPEKLVLENVCDFDINAVVKDDATHIYRETLPANNKFILETSHIWNTEGDSLFVWDERGLVIFYRY